MYLPDRRATGIDIVKALCMFGLPFVHIAEQIFLADSLAFNYNFILFFTIFGPGVFLICLGYELGTKGSPKQFVHLGIQMLVIGFLLNLVRFGLPYFLLKIFYERFDLSWDRVIAYNFSSDIYFAVGLFFLLLALFKKLKLSDFSILMICVLMLIINTIITKFDFVIKTPYTINDIIGNFIYAGEESCFPILGWAIFPVIGIFFNKFMGNSFQDRKKILRLFIASFVALLCIYVTLWFFDLDIIAITVSPSNSYIAEIFNIAIQISIAICLICVIQLIINNTKENWLERFLKKLSFFLMPYYIIHWIIVQIVSIFAVVMSSNKVSLLEVILLSVFTLIVSMFLSEKLGLKLMRFLSKITTIKKRKKTTPAENQEIKDN